MQNLPAAQRRWLFYLALAAVMMLKFFPFGIRYYPYLDDYNAYGLFYHLIQAGEKPLALFMDYGMYTSRPLGGLADALLLAPLWNRLWPALLVLILLHAASLMFLDEIFRYTRLPWGDAASAVFGLYPLLAESAYWVNAASRIVTGFFFLALSAYCLVRYFKARPPKAPAFLIAAAITGIISLGYYEQTVSFGAALYFIIMWNYSVTGRFAEKSPSYGTWRWFIWPAVYIGIIGVYYALFINEGRMAERAALVDQSLIYQIRDTLYAIARLILGEQGYVLYSLVKTEIPRILRQPLSFLPVLIVGGILSAALALLSRNDNDHYPAARNNGGALLLKPVFQSSHKGWHSIFYVFTCQIFLLLAAFGPFFILRDSFLSLRNLFFAVPVFAMWAQGLWNILCRSRFKRLPRAAAAFTVFGMLILNIGAVNAVKLNSEADRAVAGNVLDKLEQSGGDTAYRKVWLFGVKYQYGTPHGGVNMESNTLSDWAFSGLCYALDGDLYNRRYRIDRESGYFLNPIMAGGRYILDISQDDLCLTVDREGNVRRLRLADNVLYYAETETIYGYLTHSEGGSMLTEA